ncbi:PhzF family phenazine biosynthesis protein [Desulfogranum japonicum]|uniref:PhzF family phenazine biosynthesis protein n=1 Tax=Desulfogranum japonicum TaxID=231447 RepID=UPI00048E02F1|nr:PhzF family phenazine biosynthesis protein [Desulfogranum japonicum]
MQSQNLSGLKYRHVDVFSKSPLSGNGLTVFWEAENVSSHMMQLITQEMRQFESIFLTKAQASSAYRARIFTEEEELDFAGHPILGAAAVLHEQYGTHNKEKWQFHLNTKDVEVCSEQLHDGYRATMNQGKPEFVHCVTPASAQRFLKSLNLSVEDQAENFELEVISTGLPYLIVPVSSGLEQSKIVTDEFESLLASIGAKFAYVLDVTQREGRTWDNSGRLEDIATGSAAGPVGAYLHKYNQLDTNEELLLKQGRFAGRPSQISIKVQASSEHIESIYVSGNVSMVSTGIFD